MTPATGLVFAVKVALFGGAVALVPAAGAAAARGAELVAVLRLFVLLLPIQAAALVALYY